MSTEERLIFLKELQIYLSSQVYWGWHATLTGLCCQPNKVHQFLTQRVKFKQVQMDLSVRYILVQLVVVVKLKKTKQNCHTFEHEYVNRGPRKQLYGAWSTMRGVCGCATAGLTSTRGCIRSIRSAIASSATATEANGRLAICWRSLISCCNVKRRRQIRKPWQHWILEEWKMLHPNIPVWSRLNKT